jgi:hypothetical protein
MIKTIAAILLSVIALMFWGFGAFDLWATLTGYESYIKDFPAEMIAWVQGFPLWRKIVWGLSVGAGVLGALLFFLRAVAAGHALMAAFVLMIGGFLAYDLPFANGVAMYGRDGLILSSALCLVAFALALSAYSLARRPPRG